MKLYQVSVFPDIVKDCPPKMRNLPEILLRSFENVTLASCVLVEVFISDLELAVRGCVSSDVQC